MAEKDRLLTVSEAARLLRVSPLTVRRYIYSGKLKAVKTPGGRNRIPLSEIERLVGRGLSAPEEADLRDEVRALRQEVRRLASLVEAGRPQVQLIIVGMGCRKCDMLTNAVFKALHQLGMGEVVVRRLGAEEAAREFGPLLVPALIVGDKVVVSGRVPSLPRLKGLLSRALSNN